MKKIIIYTPAIYMIGGAETWLYNLTTALKDDFDFLVLYGAADKKQLDRLKVPSEKMSTTKMYECDVLINLFMGRPYTVRALRNIQVIHSNYAEMPYYKFYPWGRADEYVFVSEAAKNSFTSPINKPWTIIKNPVCRPTVEKKPRKKNDPIKLVSATRLTREKGGQRMFELCKQLNKIGVDFQYDIYTTVTPEEYSEKIEAKTPREMVFHTPRIEMSKIFSEADYLVQLSDCEAFCYSMHEALSIGTPVIVTDWKGVRDVVEDGVNGYIVDFDISNLPNKKKILSPPTNFEYEYNNAIDEWREKLADQQTKNKKITGYLKQSTNYFL